MKKNITFSLLVFFLPFFIGCSIEQTYKKNILKSTKENSFFDFKKILNSSKWYLDSKNLPKKISIEKKQIPYLEFSEVVDNKANLSINLPCNISFGSAIKKNNSIKIKIIGSSMAICPNEELINFEFYIADILENSVLNYKNGKLFLTYKNKTIIWHKKDLITNIFEKVKNKQWVLSSSELPQDVGFNRDKIPYFSFKKKSINGWTGCNRFFGKINIQKDIIKIGVLATTRMACLKDILNSLENRVLNVLSEGFITYKENNIFVEKKNNALLIFESN